MKIDHSLIIYPFDAQELDDRTLSNNICNIASVL